MLLGHDSTLCLTATKRGMRLLREHEELWTLRFLESSLLIAQKRFDQNYIFALRNRYLHNIIFLSEDVETALTLTVDT